MTPYKSALESFIVTGRKQELCLEEENGPLKTSGLFSAMHIAADLTALELWEGRIRDLTVAPMDRRYIRIALHLNAADDTYLPALFRDGEFWTAACGHNPNTIFWRSLHDTMSRDILETLDCLLLPAIARASQAGAKPIALQLFADAEGVSNHKRLSLHGARKAAKEMIARLDGPALS